MKNYQNISFILYQIQNQFQMFLWCCPKNKKAQQKNQLSQSLIENDNPSQHIANQCTSLNKYDQKYSSQSFEPNEQLKKYYQSSVEDTRSEPYNSYQKTEEKNNKRLNKTETKQKNMNEGVVPSFPKIQSLRPFSPREHQKNLTNSKKSHLWKQQIKSDLIYIDSSCTNFVYMNYRLAKNQETKQFQDGLDYFLSRSQEKIHLIIGKQQMFHKKASVLNKYSFNTISAVINNQSRYTSSFSGQIQAIFMQDLRSIRKNGINSIVIAADFLSNVPQVKEYLDIVFKDLKWEDMKKITYFFPCFMTIQEISKLLFSYIKHNIVNFTLQKASLDLCFDMELIEGSNLDSCIIVKNRSEEAKQSNAIYDHIKLSIVFFEKEFSDATQRIFIDFYIHSKQKNLRQYFEMKQFYKKNPSQFQLRMKKIKDMDSKTFSDLDSSPPLKQVRCEQSGMYFMLSNKFREAIGKLYNIPELQKKEVDTPMKKEWDDDATADDFKTTKKSSLDMVAKQELDKIDLDMGLGDDSQEEQIYDQNQDNIIINVEETNSSKYGRQN